MSCTISVMTVITSHIIAVALAKMFTIMHRTPLFTAMLTYIKKTPAFMIVREMLAQIFHTAMITGYRYTSAIVIIPFMLA